MSSVRVTPSRLALRLASVCAALAALQPLLLLRLGDLDESSLFAIAASPAHARKVFIVMLAAMPLMFAGYFIACLERIPVAPTRARVAVLCLAIWFVLEMVPRSFDVWVVSGRWASVYGGASEAGQQRLDDLFSAYRDVLYGLVFVRRHMLLVGQLSLAWAAWGEGRWGRVLAAALGLSVVRLLLGSVSAYGGWRVLDPVLDPLYYVTAGLMFPVLAVWLWSRSNAAAAES